MQVVSNVEMELIQFEARISCKGGATLRTVACKIIERYLVVPDGVLEVLLVLPKLEQRLHVTLVARLQHLLHLQVHGL